MCNPELSIIVCTHNRGPSLTGVLDNLKSQVIDENDSRWELVLVDNNSNDGTRELIERQIGRVNFSIKYMFESQQGKSFALNTGIESSTGHLLAFTDDDVILDAHWISSVFRAFRTYPTINCFGGKVLPILKTKLPSWLKDRGRYAIGGGPLVKHDRGDKPKEYDQGMWVPAGCNMFFRKALVQKHGKFSCELGFLNKNELICGEDTEIMFRFKRNGERILYYPGALIFHPAPAERLRKSYFRRYCWGAGRGEARWRQVPANCRRILNIPRYLIRSALWDIMRLLGSAFISKEYKRVFFEFSLLSKLGMIYEYYINGD